MSVANPTAASPSTTIALETAVVRNPKAPIALGIFAVLSVILFIVFVMSVSDLEPTNERRKK